MSWLGTRDRVWRGDVWLRLGIQRVGEQGCQDPIARDTSGSISEPSNVRLCRVDARSVVLKVGCSSQGKAGANDEQASWRSCLVG
jgi:hypothetical protein